MAHTAPLVGSQAAIPGFQWFADRINDYSALSTDQKIALWGAILTALATLFALVALLYARSSVKQARLAITVARDAAREDRAARRLDQLQHILAPLRRLAEAAATSDAQPAAGAQELRDARRSLGSWLDTFIQDELPHCFAALDDKLDAKAANREADAGLKEVEGCCAFQ